MILATPLLVLFSCAIAHLRHDAAAARSLRSGNETLGSNSNGAADKTGNATPGSSTDSFKNSTTGLPQKILWFSAVSLDPACPFSVPDQYLKDYIVAVASSRDVGNDAFLPHLIVHVPETVTWSSVNGDLRAKIDKLKF